MKDSLIIKFLYNTMIGRTILKGLVNPKLSKRAASFFSSRFSAWIVPHFVRKNSINLSYYEVPQDGFRSFNDFFTRKMKEEHIALSSGSLVCPCDGLLTVAKIDDDLTFHIKHTSYSISELLKDQALAEAFHGGTAYIFRLTPAHYHRYNFCTTGSLERQKRIEGILHSVQPICHEKTKVFIQNTREYTVIDSNELGKVVQMEIGALLVGKISNYAIVEGRSVDSSQEKGYFEYGGSSIVVLTKEASKLSEGLTDREKIGDEIPVKIGETLID